MKVIHKLFFFFLYVLLFMASWFSSDLFILSLKDEKSIYYSSNHIADFICISVIILGSIIILNRCLNTKKYIKHIKMQKIRTIGKLEKYVDIMAMALVFLFIYGMILSAINGVSLSTKDILLYSYRYYVYAVIIFLMTSYLPIERNKIRRLLAFFVCINLIKSFVGIYQYLSGSGFSFLVLGKVIFAEGDILINITYAMTISFAMFFAYKNKKVKLICLLAFGIFISTISVSMRRTTLLTILVLFILNIIFSSYKNKLKVILALFGLVGGLFVISNFLNVGDSGFDINTLMLRFQSMDIISNYKSSNTLLSDNGHLDDILDAIDNVKQHPVLGKGLYTPVDRYRVRWQTDEVYFHNGFLAAWVKMGILGFLTYTIMVIAIILLMLKIIRSSEGFTKYLCIGFLCIAISNVIQTNVAGSLYDFPVISINFFILLALVINHTKNVTK